MTGQPVVENDTLEALVGQVAGEFSQRVSQGERPDIDEYAQRFPEIATVLRQVLPALQALAQVSGDAASPEDPLACPAPARGVLGDFRIVREIGRGGMGVVYEAEQISLKRRVALKTLPLASAMDANRLRRFQNEAQAAACLHHTNIVPVFAVGCERSVHFYAMQFIEGQPLSAVIQDLRRQQRLEARSATS